MTNAQKWVATFLVLFILLLVLSKMTNRQGGTDQSKATENIESSENIDVENLLVNNRCFTCHGKDLNGSEMGPFLAKISENWRKSSLVSYFQNPKAFLNNPRMVLLSEKYRTEMPAIDMLSGKELEAIADYLLNK